MKTSTLEMKPSTHHKKRSSLEEYQTKQYLKNLTAQEAERKVHETCPPLLLLPDITIHKKPLSKQQRRLLKLQIHHRQLNLQLFHLLFSN